MHTHTHDFTPAYKYIKYMCVYYIYTHTTHLSSHSPTQVTQPPSLSPTQPPARPPAQPPSHPATQPPSHPATQPPSHPATQPPHPPTPPKKNIYVLICIYIIYIYAGIYIYSPKNFPRLQDMVQLPQLLYFATTARS